MNSYLKRALANMVGNMFLTLTTLFTISLSVLVAGSFLLFFENLARVTGDWNRGIRIMAYLDPEFTPDDLPGVLADLETMQGMAGIRFVSRQEALRSLQKDLESSGVVLSSLRENPLPHTLEILLSPLVETPEQVVSFVRAVEKKSHIQEVVYGHRWVEEILPMLNTLKMVSLGLGILFVTTALFVSANTVRLAFCAKQEEIEIMRLVGATDAFVNTPFYLEGLIQGGLGGGGGILVLFLLFRWVKEAIPPEAVFLPTANIEFLSPAMLGTIMGASIVLGWLGCFISLKQN